MELHLDHGEQQALASFVEERLRDLRREIAHTDRREFRAILRSREEVLEGILSRLAAESAADEESARTLVDDEGPPIR